MNQFQQIYRLKIPQNIRALLWDMDGVLIDSLTLDLTIVNELLQKHFGTNIFLPQESIQTLFAYDVPTFWHKILEEAGHQFKIDHATQKHSEIVEEYEAVRLKYSFPVNPGILETAQTARKKDIKQAVVSNNLTTKVKEVLENAGLAGLFDFVVGNDVRIEGKELQKKPAPDTYLFAAKSLGIPSKDCVVIEDTTIGIQAGKAAGCYTVGVSTGGATRRELEQCTPQPDAIYDSLAA